MEFIEAIPVAFKEITPNHNISEKWKEIVLNTGKLLTFDHNSRFSLPEYNNVINLFLRQVVHTALCKTSNCLKKLAGIGTESQRRLILETD